MVLYLKKTGTSSDVGNGDSHLFLLVRLLVGSMMMVMMMKMMVMMMMMMMANMVSSSVSWGAAERRSPTTTWET